MRTILLITTIVGGLLTLAAAVWVFELSRRNRWQPHNLDRLTDQHQRELILHSQEYQAYGNKLNKYRAGQGPAPVLPFGMDQDAHYEQLSAEYARQVQARTGRVRPKSDKDVQRDVLNQLFWPAVLAGLGVLISTTASAASLYLPPDV